MPITYHCISSLELALMCTVLSGVITARELGWVVLASASRTSVHLFMSTTHWGTVSGCEQQIIYLQCSRINTE